MKITVGRSENIIYCCLLAVFTFYKIIGGTNFETIAFLSNDTWQIILKYVIPAALFWLFLTQSIVSKLDYKTICSILIMTAFLLIESLYVRDPTFIDSFLFMLAIPRNESGKKMAGFLSKLYIFLITGTLIVSLAGGVEDNVQIRAITGAVRHSFGFVSHNTFANNVAIACLLYYYFKSETWKVRHSFIYLLIACFVYSQTSSRLAIAIIVLLSVSGILNNFFYEHGKIRKCIYFLAKWLYFFFATLNIVGFKYLASNVGSTLYYALNAFFTTRVRWGVYYLNTYGISLFGQPIETVSMKSVGMDVTKWMGLDNSYLMLGIKYGIVALVLFGIGFYLLGTELKKEDDIAGAIVTILIIFVGVTENYLVAINYNFCMIIFATTVLKKWCSTSKYMYIVGD